MGDRLRRPDIHLCRASLQLRGQGHLCSGDASTPVRIDLEDVIDAGLPVVVKGAAESVEIVKLTPLSKVD